MKTAHDLLQAFAAHLRLPPGVTLSIAERRSSGPNDPNWVAGIGAVSMTGADRFSKCIARFRKSDPIIDWSGVAPIAGQRGRRIEPAGSRRMTSRVYETTRPVVAFDSAFLAARRTYSVAVRGDCATAGGNPPSPRNGLRLSQVFPYLVLFEQANADGWLVNRAGQREGERG